MVEHRPFKALVTGSNPVGFKNASVVELVYTIDSKSIAQLSLRVRISPEAKSSLLILEIELECLKEKGANMPKQKATIKNWTAVPADDRGHIYLVGNISGHPTLGDFNGRTGMIVSINEEKGFADSEKTRYTLGKSILDHFKNSNEEIKSGIDQINEILNPVQEEV